MKKKILSLMLAVGITFSLCSCGDVDTTVITAEKNEQEPENVSFLADFYDNSGNNWLTVEGTTFSI